MSDIGKESSDCITKNGNKNFTEEQDVEGFHINFLWELAKDLLRVSKLLLRRFIPEKELL